MAGPDSGAGHKGGYWAFRPGRLSNYDFRGDRVKGIEVWSADTDIRPQQPEEPDPPDEIKA